MTTVDRDVLGRIVREAWIRWAVQQPTFKPSWVVPYAELTETDKEADRRIGEAVEAAILAKLDEALTRLSDDVDDALCEGAKATDLFDELFIGIRSSMGIRR